MRTPRDTCGCCKVLPGSGPYASPVKLFDPATNLWRIVGESLEDEARQRRTVERFLADLESQEQAQQAVGTER